MKKSRITVIGIFLLILACLAAAIYGCPRGGEKPSVVMVIIDTLPAGHVGCYGYERSTTPRLDDFAKDGVRFERAIASAPWTLPSIAGLFTGAYPSRHKAGTHLDPPTMADRRMTPMRPDMVTLAELFQERGYKTVGFFQNPFVHPGFGLDKGFDLYDYQGGDELNIRPAPLVTAAANKWIDENGGDPFFMVVHYFDPHLAYNPPLMTALPYINEYKGELKIPFDPEMEDLRSGKTVLSPEDKEYVKGLFDGEIVAVDKELGVFLKRLKEKGIYDKSLIIVTSDHGEEFWEHGGFEHGHSLHREVLEVPLVIKYPGQSHAGAEVKEYVSLLDVFPTVAEFMGWTTPFTIDGVSLYPRGGALKVPPHVIVSENLHYGPQRQAFYAENFKLIINVESGKIEVYDLSADPGETNNVFGAAKLPEAVKNQVKSIAADLEALLNEEAPAAAQLDKDTIEKLRSLGYITGGGTSPSGGDTTE